MGCLKSETELLITVRGSLIIRRCNAIWWRGRAASKRRQQREPRRREVWDTISLFHSAGRPSNTDVIKPLGKLCHYTLDKRLFDFASWHCSASDALNTDLRTRVRKPPRRRLATHVIAELSDFLFQNSQLVCRSWTLCVGSLCTPPLRYLFWNMLRPVFAGGIASLN